MTKYITWEKVAALFQIPCLIAATSTVIWCCYEFSKNEDVCDFSFKKYNEDEESIYPHISLCFERPFSENKLKEYGDGINGEKYYQFLLGYNWAEARLKVDYERVTLQLENHLLDAFVAPAFSISKNSAKNIMEIDRVTSIATPFLNVFSLPMHFGIK